MVGGETMRVSRSKKRHACGRDTARVGTRDGKMSIVDGGVRVRPEGIQDPVRGGGDVPLEPSTEPPTIAPYKASVGGWIGTGVGTVFGAGLGAGIGAIALGALSARAGGGFFSAANVGLALGGVIGAVGGGIGVYSMNKSSYENRENARIQADFGTPTLVHARNLIDKFDHDADGSIDLVNSTGLASQDERVYSEERRQSRSRPKYDFWHDEWRTETERWTETRGVSAASIWTAANVEPKDDIVSDVEVARLMARFDADRSGTLQTPEQDAFKAAHPVLIDEWRR